MRVTERIAKDAFEREDRQNSETKEANKPKDYDTWCWKRKLHKRLLEKAKVIVDRIADPAISDGKDTFEVRVLGGGADCLGKWYLSAKSSTDK